MNTNLNPRSVMSDTDPYVTGAVVKKLMDEFGISQVLAHRKYKQAADAGVPVKDRHEFIAKFLRKETADISEAPTTTTQPPYPTEASRAMNEPARVANQKYTPTDTRVYIMAERTRVSMAGGHNNHAIPSDLFLLLADFYLTHQPNPTNTPPF